MVLILGNETVNVKTNMMLRAMKTKNDKYNIVKRLDYVQKEEMDTKEQKEETSKKEKSLTTK